MSRQSVSKWELGKGYPDIENLIRLSDLYEISLDKFIKGEEKYQKNSHNNSNQKSVGDFLWNYWWLIFLVLGMKFFCS
ncbi:helix-turn-helix domain-containing protein [Lysinibacillus sphaericus]|uniref:helix-turn-helix domain-containing protein n=1 Tax=Lysinibacillus sphaericus TaxID=1421 RepID=UPI001E58C941|nr:helix-turn-helix transcriptional regulator [Lysinibacillus sphaericus]